MLAPPEKVVEAQEPASAITPKALANFSPGLERKRQPWVSIQKIDPTLQGLKIRKRLTTETTLSGLKIDLLNCTQGCRLRSNPGLK